MPRLTPEELDAAEDTLGVRLPGLYRQLLIDLGPGRHGDREVYHPSVIRELYEPFFDDPVQLFTRYLPFGCDIKRQEIWVIDMTSDHAASIWHETVPDDWHEEQWLPFDEWRRMQFPQA